MIKDTFPLRPGYILIQAQIPITINIVETKATRISVNLLNTKGTKYLSKADLITSFLGGLESLTFKQKTISALYYWILLPSKVKAAINIVI